MKEIRDFCERVTFAKTQSIKIDPLQNIRISPIFAQSYDMLDLDISPIYSRRLTTKIKKNLCVRRYDSTVRAGVVVSQGPQKDTVIDKSWIRYCSFCSICMSESIISVRMPCHHLFISESIKVFI